MSADTYLLSEEQHEHIFKFRIEPRLFSEAKPQTLPVAVIFGGQPGAGKSAAMIVATGDLEAKGGAVEIVGDDFRSFHPEYARLMREDDTLAAFYTDKDSGRWVEKAIASAQARKTNVLIEGTFRNPAVVSATMRSFHAAGYTVDARVLAVKAEFSEQGILQRYEKQKSTRSAGRMTTAAAHQAAYDGLPVTLGMVESEQLADRITVYRRGAEVLFSNQVEAGKWVCEPGALKAVEAERSRPLTVGELGALADGYLKLEKMLEVPARSATAVEINNMAALVDGATRRHKVTVFLTLPEAEAVVLYPDLSLAHKKLKEAVSVVAGLPDTERVAVALDVTFKLAVAIEKSVMGKPRISSTSPKLGRQR